MGHGMLPRPGIPPITNMIRRRAELSEDWFDLSEAELRDRLRGMGYMEQSIDKEVAAFMEYKEKQALSQTPEPKEEPELIPNTGMMSHIEQVLDGVVREDSDA